MWKLLEHSQRSTMDFDGRTSPTPSVASTMGSGYVSMAASWKAGPETVLLQCETLCQQILGAVKADVLNVDVATHHQSSEQEFRSKATVRFPSP
jgi:hypothetical protein